MKLLEKTLRWPADRFRVCQPLYYHDPGWVPSAQAFAAEVVVSNTLTSLNHARRLSDWASDSVAREFEPHRQIRFNPKPLYRLENVEVVGPSGFIKGPDGRFPLEQSWGSHEVLETTLEYRKRWWGKPTVITEPVFHLGGLFAGNYFHWLHDILPRLFGVMAALPQNVRWLVPSPLLGFQAATLARLQLNPERFLPITEGCYRISTLYYSPYWGSGAFDAPEVTRWLAEKMSVAENNAVLQPGRKHIYISRQRSARRKIVNQQEVESLLFQLGFEEVFAERLDFNGQHALFSQAKMVCGVHGAGLSNLFFCPPGAGCVELHGTPVRDAIQYWSIAEAAGMNYAVVAGRRQGSGHNDDDLIVDVAELSKAVHFMLSR